MTQFPHDQFVKDYLPELLQDYGEVTPSLKVAPEVKEIDVLFIPNQIVPTTPNTLGLLGKLAQTSCLLEVYRNSVTSSEICACLLKLLEMNSKIRRENSQIKEDNLATLWILTPTLSERILELFAAKYLEEWGQGIYIAPPGYRMGVVVIHQLPVIEETLWLRILGKGRVQEKAIRELKDLPDSNPKKNSILELVYGLLTVLRINQQQGQNLDQEDQELMKISAIYLEKLQEAENKGLERGLERGLEKGLQQEAVLLVLRLLRRKLGEIPSDIEDKITGLSTTRLETLAEELLDFNTVEDLLNWSNKT